MNTSIERQTKPRTIRRIVATLGLSALLGTLTSDSEPHKGSPVEPAYEALASCRSLTAVLTDPTTLTYEFSTSYTVDEGASYDSTTYIFDETEVSRTIDESAGDRASHTYGAKPKQNEVDVRAIINFALPNGRIFGSTEMCDVSLSFGE